MKHMRTYRAAILLLLFCCYYSGISMFSHVHIVNGSSVVHSHLGGGTEHEHSDSQYAVIDILSHFQTECAASSHAVASPFLQLLESYAGRDVSFHHSEPSSALTLRGPPQA